MQPRPLLALAAGGACAGRVYGVSKGVFKGPPLTVEVERMEREMGEGSRRVGVCDLNERKVRSGVGMDPEPVLHPRGTGH